MRRIRLGRHFRTDPDALVSELGGRILDGIRALELGRVSWIAATLIRNAERDIVRSLRRQWSQAAQWRAIADSVEYDRCESPPFGLPPGLDADAATDRLIELLTPTIGGDAGLVVAIAVVGERQEDAAAAQGLSHETGRKRYQRAVRKLRSGFDEIV